MLNIIVSNCHKVVKTNHKHCRIVQETYYTKCLRKYDFSVTQSHLQDREMRIWGFCVFSYHSDLYQITQPVINICTGDPFLQLQVPREARRKFSRTWAEKQRVHICLISKCKCTNETCRSITCTGTVTSPTLTQKFSDHPKHATFQLLTH